MFFGLFYDTSGMILQGQYFVGVGADWRHMNNTPFCEYLLCLKT
jgi:hypothetical protein